MRRRPAPGRALYSCRGRGWAALAIPLETDTGSPFPDRALIVFFAFCVILVTLLLQGLSLPFVILTVLPRLERIHVAVEEAEVSFQLVPEAEILNAIAQARQRRARNHVDETVDLTRRLVGRR